MLVLVTNCATTPPVCQMLELRGGWLRLPAAPGFVDASTYEQMYPRGVPAPPEEFVWYVESSGRFAACLPGNRYGCGDSVSYFTNGELEDVAEFSVCADAPQN